MEFQLPIDSFYLRDPCRLLNLPGVSKREKGGDAHPETSRENVLWCNGAGRIEVKDVARCAEIYGIKHYTEPFTVGWILISDPLFLMMK